jgi:anti-sigma regulatory factor (Ser/Thr protein kinase)
MEVSQTTSIEISDQSGIGHARRIASDLGLRNGFDALGVGKLAVVVTEAASNLLKHCGRGHILLQSLALDASRGIEVLAIDAGPGISDISQALRDGYSTRGTSGTGIGAIARQASEMDLYSRPGHGTVLIARLWSGLDKVPDLSSFLGGLNACHPGETVCGDSWASDVGRLRSRVMVADGLGHGPAAAEAARAAVKIFALYPNDGPADLLSRMHGALAPTRGAAVAVALVEHDRGVVRFAGLGNISGVVESAGVSRSMVSHHGTLGHDARRFQEFTYPWIPGSLLVMHSDGLSARWGLADSPGLAQRHPSVIAAALYRDHQRARDDATVVVLRDPT